MSTPRLPHEVLLGHRHVTNRRDERQASHRQIGEEGEEGDALDRAGRMVLPR